ncbi:MAG TPA: hypothetical protein VMT31_00930 [Methanomicrobiales archaeon]|jgi:hypothetical protein|nr:hypothetical protein [Methanomicrobiales archaeon]
MRRVEKLWSVRDLTVEKGILTGQEAAFLLGPAGIARNRYRKE